MKKLVKITEEEYTKLNMYKKHYEAVMKFLAIKHQDTYTNIISNMIDEVEKDVKELIEVGEFVRI